MRLSASISTQRHVSLKTGVELDYDYLIVATGATHSYFGNEEWAQFAPGLKTVEDAIEIRRRVLLAFELAERQMLGARLASAAEFRHHRRRSHRSGTRRRHLRHRPALHAPRFPPHRPHQASVLILEGSPRILAVYPDDLSRKGAQAA